MGFTRWQWYYKTTQHTNNTPHSNKHSTQNYTNNKGHTTHNECNANTITTTRNTITITTNTITTTTNTLQLQLYKLIKMFIRMCYRGPDVQSLGRFCIYIFFFKIKKRQFGNLIVTPCMYISMHIDNKRRSSEGPFMSCAEHENWAVPTTAPLHH
jgi:hypothetical protein